MAHDTEEARRARYREIIQSFTLLDDVFMTAVFKEALINSAPPPWHIFFALSVSANPPHSLCYASGLSP